MLDLVLCRIGYLWRLFATGFSFTVFGIGGLLLWWVVFPLLTLAVPLQERRTLLAKALIKRLFQTFVGLMHVLGIYTYELRGLEKLDRSGLLILANHPTLIDVVFLIALTERADCVVKAQLLRNPSTRGAVQTAGYICNDAGPVLIERCFASLQSGNNLIIFPEGTRTPAAGFPARLERGAANLAVRCKRDVTPVLIHCDQSFLAKGVPWWKIPPTRPHLTIEVHDDLNVAALIADCPSEAIAARRLSEHLIQFFTAEIRNDRHPASA
ncbi:MAG: 1-acyl-sn-glycerol-3-phosphate acyltransferase [Rhodoferax sp.]|nr:1-acyl-sn-glycerol-3-phosphate acyltransferase [Rhodoferax sp.]